MSREASKSNTNKPNTPDYTNPTYQGIVSSLRNGELASVAALIDYLNEEGMPERELDRIKGTIANKIAELHTDLSTLIHIPDMDSDDREKARLNRATDLLEQEYKDTVKSWAANVRDAIKDGAINDRDEGMRWLEERLESCRWVFEDYRAMIVCFISENRYYMEEQGLADGTTTSDMNRAYWAMRADILDLVETDLESLGEIDYSEEDYPDSDE